MMRLKTIFERFRRRWLRRRGPEGVAQALDGDSLARAMQEARFLAGEHRVRVRPLAEGETAKAPEKADDY